IAVGQKRTGMTGVAIAPAGPANDIEPTANFGAAAVQAMINSCAQAWTSKSYALDRQRGEDWAHGCQDMSLFNTLGTPNQFNDEWTNCSNSGSGGMSNISNADSYHSGGVNVLMTDGSVKFIKDTVNPRTWWSLGTRAGGEIISADS